MVTKVSFTSSSAGSKEVNDVVMVTEVTEDLQLGHEGLPFLGVSSRCRGTDETSDDEVTETAMMMKVGGLTLEHLDGDSGGLVVGFQSICCRLHDLSKRPRTQNSP